MNPLTELVQALMGGGNQSDWLWCMEPKSLERHIATRANATRLVVAQTPERLTSVSGDIAVIRAHGVLMKDARWSDEISTPALGKAFRMAGDDQGVASILADVDSPGGSAMGLSLLADDVAYAASKKPVIVQSSGLIASAAYYFSSRAHKIYAARGDLIGSIGTRLMAYDFSKLFENIGVKALPIDTGPLKSAGAFGTEVTEEQRAYFQNIVDGYQQEFEANVKQGRGFDDEQFQAVATGAVFHVAEARQLGLIDGIRTKEETLAAMPELTRSQPSSKRTKQTMSDDVKPDEPKAATLQELKQAIPNSTAEFREEQIEKGATLTDALSAWSTHQAEEIEKLKQENAEAKEQAEKAKQEPGGSKQTRGNAPQGDQGGEGEGDVDYRQLAVDYQREHKCRWSEACLAIKLKHPDARGFYGAPPKR